MPFFEHLAELRRRLLIIVVTVGVLAIAGYFFSGLFLELVLNPIRHVLPGIKQFVFLKPMDAMAMRFQAGLYMALIVGSPIIIWQVGGFFLPALKPKERRYVVPTFIAAVVFFLAGVAFTYFVILQPAFQWLFSQAPIGFTQVPQANENFNLAMLLMLIFGLAFELPVVVFYLILFNVIPYDKLKKNRLIIWFGLICVGVFVTPDWSIITMGGLALSLVVLFEGSMLFARIVLRKRIKAERIAEAGGEPEDENENEDEDAESADEKVAATATD
jgi:sec-independent protein translocase protein TatC